MLCYGNTSEYEVMIGLKGWASKSLSIDVYEEGVYWFYQYCVHTNMVYVICEINTMSFIASSAELLIDEMWPTNLD